MIAKQPAVEEPKPKREPPPFVVEDHSGEEAQQDLREALLMREWVKQQRASGNLPN